MTRNNEEWEEEGEEGRQNSFAQYMPSPQSKGSSAGCSGELARVVLLRYIPVVHPHANRRVTRANKQFPPQQERKK